MLVEKWMEHAKVVRNAIEGVWDMMEDISDTTEGVWDTMEGAWDTTEGIRDVTEDACARCLIWAAHKSCSRNDNEEVEEDTTRGNAKDNRCDSRVNLPKVPGECTTKQQQCRL